ncbi:hypothetical protein N9164_06050 [Draconibacterium sp.]|nr:hypothetical protein [Draconibacterium sp.]
MKTTTTLIFLLFFSLLLSAQSKKINESDTLSYNPSIEAVTDTLPELNIFDDDTPMNLTLKYDITSFIRQKMKGEYLDAELQIDYKDYKATKNIRLKARGNNRRETCFFPPIYLNFKTDPIERSELKGMKKIKLVTHCSTSNSHTSYLLREFLVYKIYNLLTDNSFKVKLLNIKYIDTGKKQRNYDKYGILIEPIELLTKRINSTEVDGTFVNGSNVIENEADIVALFRYMIGDTDWRIKGGHNTKYMKSLTQLSPKVTPVPYDFDYSGFVGTNYSMPQEWTSIDNVKEREYLGYCRDNDEAYLKVINLFVEKEDEIRKTIESFNYLSEKDRKQLLSYIESFYNLTIRPERFVNILKAECRTDF